jgi:hypothetical protein
MTPQPQQEWIITEAQLQSIECWKNTSLLPEYRSRPIPQHPTEWIISDVDYHVALEYFHFEARPHTPTHVPSSTELIAMAKQDWVNREERRGIHNREDWCSGWIAGFLTPNKPECPRTPTKEYTLEEVIKIDMQIRHAQHQAAAQVREEAIDDCLTALNVAIANRSFTDTDGDYHMCPALTKGEIRSTIQSLRTPTPKEQEQR